MIVRFRCDPALRDHLPPPIPARAALPDWLRAMPGHAPSDLHGDAAIRTVKHCPPFVDAMMQGFMMTLPCDVRVEGGALSWDWAIPVPVTGTHPRAPLSFHAAAQVAGTPLARLGQLVVKFNSFWTIRLEPGWSLFVTHPVNRDDLPFRLIGGMVDCDIFNEVGILFPAVWLDPAWIGVLPRGMPVAQCVPIPRQALELELGVLDADGRAAYDDTARLLGGTTGHYRRLTRPETSERPGAPLEAGPEPGGIEHDQAGPA